MRSKLLFREAGLQDLEMIFEWANDPVVRAGSFNTAAIPLEEHMKWFMSLLGDDSRILYIFFDEENPVGQLRLDFDGREAEISYSVSPSERGKGYGKLIINMVPDLVKDNFKDVDVLIGKVKKGNVASEKCFLDNGYSVSYEDDSFTKYEYVLRKQVR